MSSPILSTDQMVAAPAVPKLRARRFTAKSLRAYPALTVGTGIVLLLIILAAAASLIAPAPPNTIDSNAVLQGMSLSHPFGTDNLGRDMLSRVLYGYRISLTIAFAATAASLVIGVPLGLIAG